MDTGKINRCDFLQLFSKLYCIAFKTILTIAFNQGPPLLLLYGVSIICKACFLCFLLYVLSTVIPPFPLSRYHRGMKGNIDQGVKLAGYPYADVSSDATQGV